ncbi:glycosyltransferase family 2 protein [bacterium]|nr:glycosyltransferase family 2 protein [bacterium]
MSCHISAIIPTYNYGRFVGLAVDSALAQTAPALEVIVVDDGSTDDTRERLQTYGDRIRYVYQQNRGLSAARNTGIREARGDWVALLDSDDVWAPGKLATQATVVAQCPAAVLVATERYHFSDQPPAQPAPGGESPPSWRAITFAELLEAPLFAPSSVMIRRECFAAAGMFDESLRAVEDLDMWLRLAARHPVVRVEAPLTGVRTHPESMSTKPELMLSNNRKVLAKIPEYLPEWRRRTAWRRVAHARMYREVAWMRYAAGDRRGAVADLLRSIGHWPFALADRSGKKQRLWRAKSLIRACCRGSATRHS